MDYREVSFFTKPMIMVHHVVLIASLYSERDDSEGKNSRGPQCWDLVVKTGGTTRGGEAYGV
jgi:hypothetical protein